MKDTLENQIMKWKPILEDTNIPKEYHEEVTLFCVDSAKEWDPHPINCLAPFTKVTHLSIIGELLEGPKIPILPMNLFILSKLNDLSKIKFFDKPFYNSGKDSRAIAGLDTHKFTLYAKKSEISELSPTIGRMKIWDMYENEISTTIIDFLNEKIDDGYELWMYRPIQDMYTVEENDCFKTNYTSRVTFKKL